MKYKTVLMTHTEIIFHLMLCIENNTKPELAEEDVKTLLAFIDPAYKLASSESV